MEAGKTLRVGILCDSSGMEAWQRRCLDRINQLPFASIVAVVVNAAQSASGTRSIGSRLLKNLRTGLLLWRLYERFVLTRRSRAIRKDEMPSFEGVAELECIPLQVGAFRQSLDDATLGSLRDLEVDVLLRFGFGILTGGVLTVARHGLWSFHHGDPEHFRGAPPGFWEIHEGAPVTGVVLQRLTEALDGGVILRAGWFKTLHASYPRSLDRLLFGAADFVAQALTELHCGALTGEAVAAPGPLYRYPKTPAMLIFFARTIRAWLAEQLTSLFSHQQWSVGEVPLPVERIVEKAEAGVATVGAAKWLPEQRGRFLADPFVLPDRGQSGEDRLLAEEFDWRSGLGQIVEVVVPPGRTPGPPTTRAVIRSKMHLSYPYLFEDDDGLYCVPECAASNGVCLYRQVPGSNEWESVERLLEGFPAVDPTVFSYDGRTWLFCTSLEHGPNEVLFAWYADDHGNWTPHALNPIKIDVRSARPAGPPFELGEGLIRPAQDCSIRYGGAISFNRILALTPDEFREETFASLVPEPTGPYRSGLHTICPAGERTIIDGARMTFVPVQMARALVIKFGLAKASDGA